MYELLEQITIYIKISQHTSLSLLVSPGVVFLVSAVQHHVDVLCDVAPPRRVPPLHQRLEGPDLHGLELLQSLEHLLRPLRQLRGVGREDVPEVSDELTHADVELPQVRLDTEGALLGQEVLVGPHHHGAPGGEVTQHRHLQYNIAQTLRSFINKTIEIMEERKNFN